MAQDVVEAKRRLGRAAPGADISIFEKQIA